MIDFASAKAKQVPRKYLLKKNKPKDQAKRSVFATTYDPRLLSITSLQAKHWLAMVVKNKYLGQVFPRPPLTGYRRQPNIRSFIVRASIAKQKEKYPERKTSGMKRCNQTDCTSCPYIQEGNKIPLNGTPWSSTNKVNCLTYNIVHGIICKKIDVYKYT